MLRSAPGGRGATAARVAALARRGRDSMSQVVREFIKFGTIGGVALVVDVGLYYLLVHGGDLAALESRPVTAGVVAAVVATGVAWLGNRYWTFRHRRRSQIQREAVLFAVVNGIGIAIGAGCLAFSRYVLGLSSPESDFVAKYVVGLVLGMAFRFLMYRYVVFRGDREGGAAEEASLLDLPDAPGADTHSPHPLHPPEAGRPARPEVVPVPAVPAALPAAVPAAVAYRSPAPAFPPQIIPGTVPD